MKTALEIIFQEEGFRVINPLPTGTDEYIGNQDVSFGEQLVRFCAANGISTTNVIVYVSEELLFFKTFELPLKTPSIKDAIKFQLGLLTPFSTDQILYSYSVVRTKGTYKIALYSTQGQSITSHLQEIADAGFQVAGMYPENQRYVNRSRRKIKWILLMPGRLLKALVFNGTTLEDRILCRTEPEFDELATLGGTESIYHYQPPEGSRFADSAQLATHKPLLKEFDLLPALFRRPDYSKTLILTLLVLNVTALLCFLGIKEYRLRSIDQQVSLEITEIMPRVREIKKLRLQEQQLHEDIEKIENLAQNPDLIIFLKRLTEELPETSYLDQIRMEKKDNAVQLQGYTENIGELTSKLQVLGETKLKSTSRRRNETYFQLEVGLQ